MGEYGPDWTGFGWTGLSWPVGERLMDRIRQILATPAAKITVTVACAIFLFIAGRVVVSYFKGETPDTAFSTMFICTETGKTFRHTNKIGETQPILSPYSGRKTGVPAEACYWTADGQAKKEPTWVLLNELAGKGGPTFCPDCNRLVVGHNPAPGDGVRPPPTQAEYGSRSRPHVTASDAP